MEDDSDFENNTTDRFERKAMMEELDHDDDASAIDYARFQDVRNRNNEAMD